jgi:hypothetical protein
MREREGASVKALPPASRLSSARIHIFTHIHKLVYIYIYVCMYVCMYVYIYMCVCVCVYMYICMYIYIYICIFICIYILFGGTLGSSGSGGARSSVAGSVLVAAS